MRTATIGSGSISDRINGVTAQLKGCEDLHQVEWAWSRIVRALEDVSRRCWLVRSRGGEPPNLDGSLGWLAEVIHAHPALKGPGGELLLLIDRIAGR